MINRKRVIFDLERCICHVPDACRDCSKFTTIGPNCMESLMEDALAIIREDEKEKMQVLKELEESLLEPARMFHKMQIQMRGDLDA